MSTDDLSRSTTSSMQDSSQAATASQGMSNNADAASPRSVEGSRLNNLQRIQQRKEQVYNWPQMKKLLKMATYSACQSEGCTCTGWKTAQQLTKSPKNDLQQNFSDPCRSCTHSLETHMSHLTSVAEEELNKLLGMVIDVDNIFMGLHREEDPDTKKVYYYLFKLLRKCILSMSKPTIEGPLGQPPFERPSIAKAVTNFVMYKFSHLSQREWQAMYDLAKMFMHCLNHWNFEAPSIRRTVVTPDEALAYKINYTRYFDSVKR